jgi:hypothetical protein
MLFFFAGPWLQNSAEQGPEPTSNFHAVHTAVLQPGLEKTYRHYKQYLSTHDEVP